MTTNREKLKLIIELSQKLQDVEWVNDVYLSGELCLDDRSIALLIDIDDIDHDLVVNNKGSTVPTTEIAQLVSGETVQISLKCPRYPQAFFAKSFDDFLPNHDFKHQQPALFYLHDQDLLIDKSSDITDPVITAYQSILELIELIENNNISDHHPPGRERYFLFLGHEQKFRLPITYTADNLRKGSENIKRSIERLKDFIEDGVHPSDKRLLLKKTFIEMLAPQGESGGFAFLIENLSDLVNRFFGNFELYVGKYTFEDEKQTLLIEIRNYFRSINDAISSAQVRLVAIPLTLLVVADKMEKASPQANAFSNSIVLLGVFIFAVLMGRLTYSQKETLSAETDEINSRKHQISEKYSVLHKELKNQFDRLDRRLKSQSNTLRIINASIILVCILSTYFFFSNNTHSALSALLLL